MLNDMKPTDTDRQVIDQFRLQKLDWRLKEGIGSLQAANAAQHAELERLGQQVIAVGATVGRFMERTESDINDIRSMQQELQTEINDLKNEASNNSGDILLTQRILFDKMSSAEQVQALDNGFLASLTAAAKKRLRVKADVRQKQEQLTKKLADFSRGASALAQLAGNLGVEPNVVTNIQTAAAVADAAGAVVIGMATGPVGYIQAAAAISGLVFGGAGGPDPAEARHGAIMKKLGEIREQLNVLQEKLDLVIEGQGDHSKPG